MFVAIDGQLTGILAVADEMKSSSLKAVQELQSMGLKVIMLTGDREETATAIAQKAGIQKVIAGVLPDGKATAIKNLQEAGKKLAMVGDGINDAPVLTRADIGIAMGAMGSDAAIEAADVVLMDDDPMKISQAIRISRKCLAIVNQNTWFSIGIKLVVLLLGAVGIANMWFAIFADVGVMILAVLNAMRALFAGRTA